MKHTPEEPFTGMKVKVTFPVADLKIIMLPMLQAQFIGIQDQVSFQTPNLSVITLQAVAVPFIGAQSMF